MRPPDGRRAHVVGAGLAGLSAALRLGEAGWRVTLSEAGPQAGGRCRSYHDPQLDCVIDNGNHFVASGNHAVNRYLASIGSAERLSGPAHADFAFADVRDGARWRVRLNDGPLPWWVLRRARRPRGVAAADFLPVSRLLRRRDKDTTVGALVRPGGRLWDELLDPVLTSALNTPAATGSAHLARSVLTGSLARGGAASRPRVAEPTLAATFIDPALDRIRAHGGEVRFGRRLRAVAATSGRATALTFTDGSDPVGPGDIVVLATPAWVTAELLPGLRVPTEHNAIVNAHFMVPPPPGAEPIVAVIGGTAEWVVAFHGRLSVTVSAANRLLDRDRDALARALWADVAAVHGLSSATMPPHRLVIEKRATFAATPAQDALRPHARDSGFANIVLAGDWTQTGLPATIEGAIGSGETAARLANRAAAG